MIYLDHFSACKQHFLYQEKKNHNDWWPSSRLRLEHDQHCEKSLCVPDNICWFTVKPLELQAVCCFLTFRDQVLLLPPSVNWTPGSDSCHVRHRISPSVLKGWHAETNLYANLLIPFPNGHSGKHGKKFACMSVSESYPLYIFWTGSHGVAHGYTCEKLCR